MSLINSNFGFLFLSFYLLLLSYVISLVNCFFFPFYLFLCGSFFFLVSFCGNRIVI